MKYKLAYVFGTYNRLEFIEYVKDVFLQLNSGLYILDGSENNDTKKVISNYNFELINYHHLPDWNLSNRIVVGFNIADVDYICYGRNSNIFS